MNHGIAELVYVSEHVDVLSVTKFRVSNAGLNTPIIFIGSVLSVITRFDVDIHQKR
jgi:hypothetical protein